MRATKHTEIIDGLIAATRKRKLDWRPLDPSAPEWDCYLTTLPGGQTFKLEKLPNGTWEVEVRDGVDRVVDVFYARPFEGETDIDLGVERLLAEVAEAATLPLQDTLTALTKLVRG